MRVLLVTILSLLAAISLARTISFTADFDLTSPTMKNGGGFAGRMKYSWDFGAFETSLTNHGIRNLQTFSNGPSQCSGADCKEKKFCIYNLDLNVGDTFNIADWVWYPKDPKTPVDYKECNFQFYYDSPTNPPNWHLADYMTQSPVTVTAADADNVPGTGNHGDGAYRIFMKDDCGTDTHMTIRVFADHIDSDVDGQGVAARGCGAQRGYFSYEIGSCGCQKVKIDYSQPQFFYDPTFGYFAPSNGVETINGVSCNRYPRGSQSSGLVENLWLRSSDNLTPCRVQFQDGRVFTFSNVVLNPVFTSADFAAPTTCGCSRPVDLVVALERSSSVTSTAFQAERDFALSVASNFKISGAEAQIATATFGDTFSLTSPLIAGGSETSVTSALRSLTCDGTTSCANTGAKVVNAINGAVAALLGAGARPQAAKAIVIVTDGWTDSTADVHAAAASVAQQIPGLKIFVVGSDGLLFSDLSALALGIDDNVVPVIWPQFTPESVAVLSSRVCRSNVKPCGDCCGFCDCDQCIAPDHCDTVGCDRSASNGRCCVASADACAATNICSVSTCVNDTCSMAPVQCQPDNVCFSYGCSAGVCLPTPKSPPAAANQCEHYECDTTAGFAWKKITKPCTGDDPCLNYVCGPSVGCKAVAKVPLPPNCTSVSNCICDSPDKCLVGLCEASICTYSAKPCDDANACTDDSCAGGSCINLPKNCNDGNPCTLDTCQNGNCVHTANPCDDKNACTIDTCDFAVGCKHEAIECNDDDLCTNDTCDPTSGQCAHTSVVCSDDLACTNNTCHPFKGCQVETISCPSSGSCTLDFCQADANNPPSCVTRKLTCTDKVVVAAVATSLGVASIIGIVVGVVVFVGVAGGASYAAYQKMATSDLRTVENNPIYKAAGTNGGNPLYRGE